jgi:hypothetical protein
MKRSLLTAAAILVAGAISALLQRRGAAELDANLAQLRKQAATLGIQTEGGPVALAARAKRQREETDRRAKEISADVMVLARDLEAAKAAGTEPDAATQERAMTAMMRLAELDPARIREVIDALRNDPDLSDEIRGNLVSFSILMLADDRPEAAVNLYAECAAIIDKDLLGEHVVATALGRWAEQDPAAALEWLRKNATGQPELANEDAKNSILSGVAARDPALAFRMIDEIGLEDSTDAIHSIMAAGVEDESARTDLLQALRGHLATVTDADEREAMSSKGLELLARGCDGTAYDSLSAWIGKVQLSETEKQQFASGLTWYTTKGETGQWVEWISSNLPSSSVADPVRELVGEWTQQDYVAAGQWLTQTPEGPARTAAVESYAAAVAEYEPQIATQWALTLPPGPSRDATMRAIYENWPPSDPQGAGAFAREHGLE